MSEQEKQRGLLLIEHIRTELADIVKRELGGLEKEEEYMKRLPEITRKKMEDLIDAYKDIEKVVSKLGALGILGLTSKTAKVATVSTSHNLPDMSTDILDVGPEPDLSISGYALFRQHPSGPRFELQPNKKYRIIVAFIPEVM